MSNTDIEKSKNVSRTTKLTFSLEEKKLYVQWKKSGLTMSKFFK